MGESVGPPEASLDRAQLYPHLIQQLTLEAMQFCLVPAITMVVDHRQCFVQRGETFLTRACLGLSLSKRGEHIQSIEILLRAFKCAQAGADLDNPGINLSPLGQQMSLHDQSCWQPV